MGGFFLRKGSKAVSKQKGVNHKASISCTEKAAVESREVLGEKTQMEI
jgi:hypothetical protein